MEPIDVAFERFLTLVESIDQSGVVITEQDTRIKIIDRLIVDVLGWDYIHVNTEEPAGTGYLDYKLSIEDRARLVIEAKRDSRSLGLDGNRSALRPSWGSQP